MTCAICDGPVTIEGAECWSVDDNGRRFDTTTVCSPRCAKRHERSQWSAGREYYQRALQCGPITGGTR